MFENIPPWAMQQAGQRQGFNPAPMIMSPYMHGQAGGMQLPPMPPPATDPSGATSGTPQGLGGVSSLLSDPNAANGGGGLLKLIQAMQQMQQQNAPIVDPATGQSAPAHANVTPGIDWSKALGSVSPGIGLKGLGGLAQGSMFDWLGSLFR